MTTLVLTPRKTVRPDVEVIALRQRVVMLERQLADLSRNTAAANDEQPALLVQDKPR